MNLLVLGAGKTGSLVAQAAREHRHHVRVLRASENPRASALTSDNLRDVAVVIDFTNPQSVLENIAACIHAKKAMVVGTTGWYEKLPNIRQDVEQAGIGLVFGANFSIGVNLFFDVARSSAAALKQGYTGQVFERHHAQKKDAPSGTAIAIQNILREASGTELEITSFREGDVVGMHELIFESTADRIYLCHDAKSRKGFAEGAVGAAEWIVGKAGFYDFKEIWREV